MLHATRSGKEDGDDGPRTEGWDSNPTNTGSFQDVLLFEDGTQVICCDWDKGEFPQWCAGYGAQGSNTWAASDHYIQIEVAQGVTSEPFKPAQIDSLAQLVAELANRYDFPIVKLPYLTQKGTPPRGITSHDNCANGTVYGKTDPGYMFPWDYFLLIAESYRTGETMDYVTQEQFRQLLLRLCVGKERGAVTVNEADALIADWLANPLEKQSISDVAHSALSIALTGNGAIDDDMTDDEVRAIVAEEISRARVILP